VAWEADGREGVALLGNEEFHGIAVKRDRVAKLVELLIGVGHGFAAEGLSGPTLLITREANFRPYPDSKHV
jgi:hypothetical protein